MTARKEINRTTLRITVTALFMAMNVALSSFGVPVPGGHLYLNDVVIVLAALLLGPFEAFVVGGVGAFLGDLFFYPTPMFVSLVTHGLQAVVISLISQRVWQHKPKAASVVAALLGAIIMVVGYTLGRAYIYSTPEYAVLKLPFQSLQAGVGVVFGLLLCWKCGIKSLYEKTVGHRDSI